MVDRVLAQRLEALAALGPKAVPTDMMRPREGDNSGSETEPDEPQEEPAAKRQRPDYSDLDATGPVMEAIATRMDSGANDELDRFVHFLYTTAKDLNGRWFELSDFAVSMMETLQFSSSGARTARQEAFKPIALEGDPLEFPPTDDGMCDTYDPSGIGVFVPMHQLNRLAPVFMRQRRPMVVSGNQLDTSIPEGWCTYTDAADDDVTGGADAPTPTELFDQVGALMRHTMAALESGDTTRLGELVKACRDALKGGAHSVFSHSYDWQAPGSEGGGDGRVPARNFFYSKVDTTGKESDDFKAHRSDDVLAAFRRLCVLSCLVSLQQASTDRSGSTASAVARAAIDAMMSVHEKLLEFRDAGAGDEEAVGDDSADGVVCAMRGHAVFTKASTG